MAPPTTLLWHRDPHTAAKHQLLQRYLMAWFPIVATTSRNGVTYVDGFAGPGKYLNSDESSPVIALNQACRTDVAGHGNPIRLAFLEADKARFEHLRDLIDSKFPGNALPGVVKVETLHGKCETELVPALDRLGAWAGPIFANLDGWGVDTPFDVVSRIAENPSSEVLVTFQDQFFRRFATLDDITAGDRVFGHRGWRRVADLKTAAKRPFLVDEYRKQLHSVGLRHTLTFEMIDEGGRTLFLIFGTSRIEGVVKMKDALWTVDAAAGQSFRDPKDPAQLQFTFDDPDFTPLRKDLFGQLDVGEQSLEQLRDFTIAETVYKGSHTKPVVDRLVSDDIIEQTTTGRSFADKRYRVKQQTSFF